MRGSLGRIKKLIEILNEITEKTEKINNEAIAGGIEGVVEEVLEDRLFITQKMYILERIGRFLDYISEDFSQEENKEDE